MALTGTAIDLSALSTIPIYGALYALYVGLPSMLFIGLPLHFVLRKLNLSSALAYLGAGLVGGVVAIGTIFAVIALSFGAAYSTPLQDAFTVLPLGLTVGACIALTFWIVRRPDRDTPANPPTSAS